MKQMTEVKKMPVYSNLKSIRSILFVENDVKKGIVGCVELGVRSE